MALKKAQLFSMIALMMSVFFILVFSSTTHVPLDNDVDQVYGEVQLLNDVVLDLPTLVESAVESSSLQILNFSVDHLNGSNYFPSFKNFFSSCFETGYFFDYTDSLDKICSLSNTDVSFTKLLNDIFHLTGEVYNLDISIISVNHSMYPSDAYSLEVDATVVVDIKLISKKKNIAWKRKISVSQQIDYTGITDPASIGTNFVRKIVFHPGVYPNPDKRTFTRVGFNGDFNLVQDYISNTYYFVDKTGPSFIDRMEGKQTEDFLLIESNEFGIATFISPFNESGDSLYIEGVSMIDHHYDWGAKPDIDYLRFFNSTSGINRNITLYYSYAIAGLFFDDSVDLEDFEGNCDGSGCEYP